MVLIWLVTPPPQDGFGRFAAIAETLLWMLGLAARSEMILMFIVPGPEAEWEQEPVAAVLGMHLETLFTPEEMSAVIGEAHLRAQVCTPEQVKRPVLPGSR